METGNKCRFLFFMLLIMRFQEYRTQGGTQCQGVQSGQTNSDRHRQTKLAIERTGRTSHETYGNKHGHHDQRNGNNSATQLAHGIDRS